MLFSPNICTRYSLCQECPFLPFLQLVCNYQYLKIQLKYHLLQEAFKEYPLILSLPASPLPPHHLHPLTTYVIPLVGHIVEGTLCPSS